MSIIMDLYGLSDIGKERDSNQDQFLIGELSRSLLIHQTSLNQEDDTRLSGDCVGELLLVADGVGGSRGGAKASKIAVNSIANYLLNMTPWLLCLTDQHEDDFENELKSAMKRCHVKIESSANEFPDLKEMATTLTMAYVIWPKLYVVHVGDSRCYLFRSSKLEQITKDHTYAQQMVEDGTLNPEEAEGSRWSNVLWNALGGDSEKVSPEVYKARLELGDLLLLCTDGLTKHVSNEDMVALLKKDRPSQSICESLVNAANEGGGSDNITVAVARF